MGIARVDLGDRTLDSQRRPHSALGVVLLRLRIAEEGHQPVAELLQHVAAKLGHRLRRFVEIGVDQVAPVLGVELGRKARRSDEVAEQDRDRAALGSIPTDASRDNSLRRGRPPVFGLEDELGVELLDRGHDLPPMADDGDAQVLQVVDRQLRQHRAVDFIVPERRLILPKAEAPQPNPDIHRRFLRSARMMVLRGHGVYGFGPLRSFGQVPPITRASSHRRCLEAGWCPRIADGAGSRPWTPLVGG